MMDNPALFRSCLAASLAVHGALLLAGRTLPRLPSSAPPLEIDLTLGAPALGPKAPGRPGTGTPGGFKVPEPAQPPAAGAPQAMAPAVPVESPAPEAATPEPAGVAARLVEWISQTSPPPRLEKPAEPEPAASGGASAGTESAAAGGGASPGARFGTPGGTGTAPAAGSPGSTGTGGGGSGLLSLPRLLNGAEVRAGMQRLFPESERAADREGKVTLMLRIGADGRVEPGDIVLSAGPAFDAAAKEVVKLMRFEPARSSAGPVAVQIKQPVIFRLEDD